MTTYGSSRGAFFFVCALVLALALRAGAVDGAVAQDAAGVPPSILVLDMDTVLRNSIAMRSLEEKLRVRDEEGIAAFSAREQNLVNEGRELQSQRDVLSATAFEERAQDFDDRGQALRQEAQDYGDRLQRVLRDGLQEVQGRALAIAEEVALEMGADMVLSKDTLFLLNEGLEITPAVFERLNAELGSTESETCLLYTS
ncbi:MAG: OmpH family outer membrane protein, partial [Alphaproteobacteria bacterium]|nr:OmpH family outer membrane protein [Alphaproteobacteria bacterium]